MTWLPDNEPRCRNRINPCTKADHCARALADIGQRSPVADLSRGIMFGIQCDSFMPDQRKPEPVEVVRDVKPWPTE